MIGSTNSRQNSINAEKLILTKADMRMFNTIGISNNATLFKAIPEQERTNGDELPSTCLLKIGKSSNNGDTTYTVIYQLCIKLLANDDEFKITTNGINMVTKKLFEIRDKINTAVKFEGNVWSISTATLNRGRSAFSGFGSKTSALAASGSETSVLNSTEKLVFDTWTMAADVNTGRIFSSGCGSSSNGLITGGYLSYNESTPMTSTERFNGFAWLNGSQMMVARQGHACCGTACNILVAGGVANNYNAEVYDGNSWRHVANMTASRVYSAGSGNPNNGLIISGTSGSSYTEYHKTAEKFNGALWAFIGPSLNAARPWLTSSGSGDRALAIGGVTTDTPINSVEAFNYNSWSIVANMNIARQASSSGGSYNDTIVFGGETKNNVKITSAEVFIGKEVGNFFNECSWKSSSNINIARSQSAGCGNINSAIIACGYDGTIINTVNLFSTEIYNGNIWFNSVNTNVNRSNLSGCGKVNGFLIVGGASTTKLELYTEMFNGIEWRKLSNVIRKRNGSATCGTIDNVLTAGGGGDVGGHSVFTEKFNGSVWSASTDMNVSRYLLSSTGIGNNAVITGGQTAAREIHSSVETFDGSVWHNLTDMNIKRSALSSCGYSLVTGGSSIFLESLSITEELIGGITWSIISDMNQSRSSFSSCGDTNNAIAVAGGGGLTILLLHPLKYLIKQIIYLIMTVHLFLLYQINLYHFYNNNI